ncbi:MAG: hypothetical protein JJU19_17160 [Pararhodobacter sp.]|nr:hypothetical protein [Pararhodobacter sp.]
MKPLDAHPPLAAFAVGTPAARRRSARKPLAWRIPVLGAILRELAEGDPDFPFYAGLSLACLAVCAVLLWGLPALVVTALLATPVMGTLLILITRG